MTDPRTAWQGAAIAEARGPNWHAGHGREYDAATRSYRDRPCRCGRTEADCDRATAAAFRRAKAELAAFADRPLAKGATWCPAHGRRERACCFLARSKG